MLKFLHKLLAVMLVLFILFPIAQPVSASSARTITIFAVNGANAWVYRPDNTRTPARERRRIQTSDTLVTAASTTIDVRMDQASLLRIDQNSRVTVGAMGGLLRLTVDEGNALAQISEQSTNRGIEARLGSVAMTVRGTVFTFGFNATTGVHHVTMLSGSGEIDGIILTAGQMLSYWENPLLMADIAGNIIHDHVRPGLSHLVVSDLHLEDINYFTAQAILDNQDYLLQNADWLTADIIAEVATVAETLSPAVQTPPTSQNQQTTQNRPATQAPTATSAYVPSPPQVVPIVPAPLPTPTAITTPPPTTITPPPTTTTPPPTATTQPPTTTTPPTQPPTTTTQPPPTATTPPGGTPTPQPTATTTPGGTPTPTPTTTTPPPDGTPTPTPNGTPTPAPGGTSTPTPDGTPQPTATPTPTPDETPTPEPTPDETPTPEPTPTPDETPTPTPTPDETPTPTPTPNYENTIYITWYPPAAINPRVLLSTPENENAIIRESANFTHGQYYEFTHSVNASEFNLAENRPIVAAGYSFLNIYTNVDSSLFELDYVTVNAAPPHGTAMNNGVLNFQPLIAADFVPAATAGNQQMHIHFRFTPVAPSARYFINVAGIQYGQQGSVNIEPESYPWGHGFLPYGQGGPGSISMTVNARLEDNPTLDDIEVRNLPEDWDYDVSWYSEVEGIILVTFIPPPINGFFAAFFANLPIIGDMFPQNTPPPIIIADDEEDNEEDLPDINLDDLLTLTPEIDFDADNNPIVIHPEIDGSEDEFWDIDLDNLLTPTPEVDPIDPSDPTETPTDYDGIQEIGNADVEIDEIDEIDKIEPEEGLQIVTEPPKYDPNGDDIIPEDAFDNYSLITPEDALNLETDPTNVLPDTSVLDLGEPAYTAPEEPYKPAPTRPTLPDVNNYNKYSNGNTDNTDERLESLYLKLTLDAESKK
ncbi:MAG: FecR domain-containing protein [Defluviitaleaceae bacterium]|nr:FecR domain-containing protein [Defluviitaleaceae bacterium]